ncbi:MAG: calcineurin-like phosphoesterase C-terminal domain-containing protein [Armatimonadetes bacterium]|nr:calcineurin-like phosphoesterase C-terminal domain-containing protein [Armatimonadota bacterium]
MSFSFIHFTDLHLGEGQEDSIGIFRQMIHEINALDPQPSFVLQTGDICLQSGVTIQEQYLRLRDEFDMPAFDVPGNHDTFVGEADSKATYRQLIGRETFYSFDHGGAHFIALDGLQEDPRYTDWRNIYGEVRGEEWEWLKSDLSSVVHGTPVVVFLHIPVLSTFPNRQGYEPRQMPSWEIANDEELHELFSTHGVRLVLAGHVHENETIARDGVTYVSTGAVCGRWWSNDPLRGSNTDGSPRGYRIVTVAPAVGEVSWTYKGIGLPESEQLEAVVSREEVPTSTGEPGFPLLVNVYDGHAGWRVEAAVEDEEWQALSLTATGDTSRSDETEGVDENLKASGALTSAHLWRGTVPRSSRQGGNAFAIRVRATDPWCRQYEALMATG